MGDGTSSARPCSPRLDERAGERRLAGAEIAAQQDEIAGCDETRERRPEAHGRRLVGELEIKDCRRFFVHQDL